MKIKLTAIALVAIAALAFAPKPARAGDEGIAAIGGFIGGVIVGSVINNDRHDRDYPVHGSIGVDVGYNRGGYDHRGGYDYDRGGYGHDNNGRRNGYWKNVTVRHWVPERWIIEYDHRGCEYHRIIPGHYVLRRERVWVSYDCHDRYDRNDGYGRGYGYNR